MSGNGKTKPVRGGGVNVSMPTENERRLPTINEMMGKVENVLSARRAFSPNGDERRNLEDDCGWPERGTTISPEMYRDTVRRNGIAARAVEVLPKETWQVQPSVYESEDPNEYTPFEQAWDNFLQSQSGSTWYRQEEGSSFWAVTKRLDILSGIGHFGIAFIGFNDGVDPAQPIKGVVEQHSMPNKARTVAPIKNAKPYKLVSNLSYPDARVEGGDGGRSGSTGMGDEGETHVPPSEAGYECRVNFIRVFPEHLVQIVQWESNPHSPRLGLPVRYMITLNDADDQSGIGVPTSTMTVHWTRVLHVPNENMGTSEVFAAPTLEPLMDDCLDLKKIFGASGEGYYRSCFTGMAFETHPQLGGDVNVNTTALKDMWEAYSNGLDRALFLMGMTAKPIAPTVIDPTSHINARIEVICIKLGCPVRVFKGSERGELASSQDDAAWNDRLRQRQRDHVTPRIIVQLVDRLIMVGVLPVPAKGYSVYWPDLTSQSKSEKAAIAAQMTTALVQFISGGGDALITPRDFLTLIMQLTDEEADSVLENIAAQNEQDMAPTIDEPLLEDDAPTEPAEESFDESTQVPA